MTTDNIAFHNPTDLGIWDLSTSQENKIISFEWDTTVIPEAKIVIVSPSGGFKKTYTVGVGLVLSNADKTVRVTLQGIDFIKQCGKTLDASCSFFTKGDIELVFKLKIINSPL